MTSISCSECNRQTDVVDLTKIEIGYVLCPPCQVKLRRVPREIRDLKESSFEEWKEHVIQNAWDDCSGTGKCLCYDCQYKAVKEIANLDTKILWLKHLKEVSDKANKAPYLEAEILQFTAPAK